MLDLSSHVSFPWREGNSICFLVDGHQFYPAILRAIKSAQRYILMEMYLFESGKIADQFINAFVDAAQRGLNVQLLVDAYGTLGLSNIDRDKLKQAGVQFVLYNPLMFKKFKKNLFRTHRKYMVIDGEIAFVGGAGITDSFQGSHAWRETVIEITGDVIADWQTLFAQTFSRWSDEKVPLFDAQTSLLKRKQQTVRARLAYTSGGTSLEIKKELLNRVNNSKQSTWFASAYFVPSRKIRKALRKSAIKDNDVRLLLPGEITDHPAVRHASRRYYARLLRFGVRIYEYQGRFTHTKMVLVDDWLTIGSSNMDRWNFRWNLEANLEVEDNEVVNQARKIMLHDFKNCHEITYDNWVNRSKIQRFKEWMWGKLDLFLTNYK